MTSEDKVPEFGTAIREEFMLRKDSVFLNHGSYGSLPRCVHERQVKYLVELEQHPDIWFRYNMYKYLDNAIDKVASFMGVNSADTFLVQNVTKAINTVQRCYPFKSGDAILLTSLTYGAVKVTARVTMGAVLGGKIHFIDIKFPIESEDDIVAKYEKFLSENPDVKMAVIDHITSPSCVIMPVKRLTQLCHKYDVIVVVDAAHIPGQMDVDIADIDADFYTGNLHKWLFCPRSAAFLWSNPKRRHDWFRPLVTSAFEYKGLKAAFAYEGTKDDIPYLCAMDGIEYFNRLGGLSKVQPHNTSLLRQGVKYLEERLGVQQLQMPGQMRAPYLAVLELPTIKGYTDVKDEDTETAVFGGKNLELQKLILDQYDVQIAVVIIDDTCMLRVCASVYNTMEDYAQLADAILDLAKVHS